MARQQDRKAAVRRAEDAIVALTDVFCQQHLNDDYRALCRQLADELARKRPSPLTKGKPQVWCSAIVRVIGWVNLLDDPSQAPHLKLTDIDRGFRVSTATGKAKAMAIRRLCKIQRFDPKWMLPSRSGDNRAYRKRVIRQLSDETKADAADEDQPGERSGTDISRTGAADAAVLVGELHLRQGEYAKAIAAFTRAIENDPTADAYQGRANAYRGLAETDDQKAREHSAKEARPPSP